MLSIKAGEPTLDPYTEMVGKLFFQPGELVLRNSLHCGQSFRWVIQEHTGFFYSTLKLDDSYDLVMLRQLDDNCIEYDCYKRANLEKLESHLKDYFELDVSLNNLMTQWSDADPKGFQNKEHRGVRVLNQNPWETLCSFICSSNNNISRITKMCHSLATEFGDEIAEFDGAKQYSFPSSDQIVERASEEKLRDLGFGYRAKYIIGTAQLMSCLLYTSFMNAMDIKDLKSLKKLQNEDSVVQTSYFSIITQNMFQGHIDIKTVQNVVEFIESSTLFDKLTNELQTSILLESLLKLGKFDILEQFVSTSGVKIQDKVIIQHFWRFFNIASNGSLSDPDMKNANRTLNLLSNKETHSNLYDILTIVDRLSHYSLSFKRGMPFKPAHISEFKACLLYTSRCV